MGRRRSLYARLALVLLAVLVLVGAGWVAAAALTTRLYQEELEQRLNRDLARQLLKDTDLLEQGLDTDALAPAPDDTVPPAPDDTVPPALEHIFHVLMVVNPRIEVYLLAPDGRIVAYSAPEGRVVRQRVDLGPVERFLAGGERLPIRGDDPRSAHGRKIFSAAVIPAPGGGAAAPAGYLYVVLGGEQYESVVARLRSSYMLRLAAGVAVGALVVALVAGLLLFRRLTRRLEALDERIRAFRPAGAPDAEPQREGDEIDRLEGAFERMRERIEAQVGELAALDEMRRELVANVSHDLRTPLAALRGYLETLQLKDGELAPEQRREYLDVALRHGEQLSHLVERLFELARLDVEEARLRLEAVSLAELAQDVVQKFDLDAQRLGVALQAELPRRLPPVRGDIRLLERVLDNLIENALHHTPSGGKVRVEVRETGSGVEVRLADTGAGIPEEELPHVFERFHRGADPGRRQRPGAGLGLAISQRILELHGTALEVESAVGRGTVFTFRLPHTRH